MPRRALLLGLMLVLPAPPAATIVVDGPHADRTLQPPPGESGWAHVGIRGTNSAIYLGGGWVLSANHTGMGEVIFDRVGYPPVPGSRILLDAPGGLQGSSDLALFRVDPAPDLPPLPLRREPVTPGTVVTLVGHGRGAGEPVTWRNRPGLRAAKPSVKRWGMNLVNQSPIDVRGPGAQTITRCFQTTFDQGGGPHEAQAVKGDSGGAVFVSGPDGWQLAGVMISVWTLADQPRDVVLYGSRTNAADISSYLPQILQALERDSPAPESAPGESAPAEAAHPLP